MQGPSSAVTSVNSYEVEPTPWGRLVWMVAGRLGNSTTMTMGKCFIAPGSANPRHYHPNCDEVLHVLHGDIEHSLNGHTFRMSAGETLNIPMGSRHNARNIGKDEAALLIAFSSADRQTVLEQVT
jgi:quercetin dioxygenase-like cupin family protein